MKAVSVIITAYNTADYIEPCLESVIKQTYRGPCEILLGIDNCKETLEAALAVRHRYNDNDGSRILNLRIFMMRENYGTYVVSNTLIDNSRGDYILRFDSDDLMKSDMIKTLVNQDADIVVMKYATFGRIVQHPNRYSFGQALFKREVFDACGGYSPWRCAADKELLNRASLKFEIKKLNDRLFFKRMHKGALTKAEDTGRGSAPRREAHRKLRELSDKGIIKIERVTGNYEEL